jgi:hypothetical protein
MHKADVNSVGKYGNTPLRGAMNQKHTKVARCWPVGAGRGAGAGLCEECTHELYIVSLLSLINS